MSLLNYVYDKPLGRADGVAAPIRGLNTETPLAGQPKDYAVELDNFICQPDALVTRLGCEDYVINVPGNPSTLMTYSAGASNKLFAASNTGIYDCSVAGDVGAGGTFSTAISAGYGKAVNFGTSAGQYLMFVNGVDTPRLYNGTAWSISSIAGTTSSDFFAVETYRQRLYFLRNNDLAFWYLAADSITGTAVRFNIGSVCRRGGRAAAIGTWSIDGGSGPDDHIVIVTSEGEVVVYRGSDPAVVANWVYVGTFYVGRPLGADCLSKFGGDLLFLSENGVIAMSQLTQSTVRNYSMNVTSKIQPTLTALFRKFGASKGFHIHIVPSFALLILNIPRGVDLPAIQYVYNTYAKGWSSFSGWDARHFIQYDGNTYFASGDKIVKALTGYSDYGKNITATCATSYNRFKTRSQLVPSMVRALYASNTGVSYSLGIASDFSGVYSTNGYGSGGGAPSNWDTGLWDLARWGGDFQLYKDWVTTTSNSGIAISARFRVASKYGSTVLLAFDFKFLEQGLVS